MANGIVTAILEDLQDHLLLVGAMSQPAAIYCSLWIGDPLGAGAEVTGTAYARENSTFGAATTLGEVVTSANSVAIDFGTAGAGGWGTVTHFALFSAITGGTMLASVELDIPKVIAVGDPVKFNIGECKLTATRT